MNTFHMQAKQSRVQTLNHLCYVTLIHQANISPALNQPRQLETTPKVQSPLTVLY